MHWCSDISEFFFLPREHVVAHVASALYRGGFRELAQSMARAAVPLADAAYLECLPVTGVTRRQEGPQDVSAPSQTVESVGSGEQGSAEVTVQAPGPMRCGNAQEWAQCMVTNSQKYSIY